MQISPYGEPRRSRAKLPWWALFAAMPLVLALGFISGILLAAYRPPTAAPPQPGGQLQPSPATQRPESGQSPPTAPAVKPDGPRTTEANPPVATGVGRSSAPLPQAVDQPLPSPGSTHVSGGTGPNPAPREGTATGGSQPSAGSGLPVRSLVDARAVLSAEFGTFQAGGRKLFSVDYQRARDINYNVVLIGIVEIDEYPGWLTAVSDHPEELAAWLKAAAVRVRPAALSEKFSLTWTIYETVAEPPVGFAGREITPDPRGGGYVVTRTLAAITDMAQPAFTIAAVPTMSRPATAETPWAAYGPVIRFDPTDLYRPVPATKKP